MFHVCLYSEIPVAEVACKDKYISMVTVAKGQEIKSSKESYRAVARGTCASEK